MISSRSKFSGLFRIPSSELSPQVNFYIIGKKAICTYRENKFQVILSYTAYEKGLLENLLQNEILLTTMKY